MSTLNGISENMLEGNMLGEESGAEANYMAGGNEATPASVPPVQKKKDRTMLYIFGACGAAFAAYAAWATMGTKHAHQDTQFAPLPAAVQLVAPVVPAAPAAPASNAPTPTVSTVSNPLAAGPQAIPTASAVSAPKAEKVRPAKTTSDNAAVPQTTVKVMSPTASETSSQAPAQSGDDGQISTRMDKLEHRVGHIEVAVNRIERAIHPEGRVKHYRKSAHGKHKHLGKHHEKAAHKNATATATVDSAIKVQAVTPGRVWIMDKKGETHTYTLGDKLPNGAEIKGVDADSGIIETSKGNIM